MGGLYLYADVAAAFDRSTSRHTQASYFRDAIFFFAGASGSAKRAWFCRKYTG